MSLDNTSHPGRAGPDELVPSRYALRVGEIDVMVVSDGVLSLPGAMLAHNVDPAVRAAWLEDMFLPPDMLEWPLNVVVVRSGGRTILIDAGLGVEFPDFPRAGRLALRLETAGIDLASVTDVVLTHMRTLAGCSPTDPFARGGCRSIRWVQRFRATGSCVEADGWRPPLAANRGAGLDPGAHRGGA